MLLSGCVSSSVAKKIVKAPNRQAGLVPAMLSDSKMLVRGEAFYAETWRMPVESPNTELAVAVINPGDYGFVFDINDALRPDGGGKLIFDFDFKSTKSITEAAASRPPPKATLMLLHGYALPKESMIFWAFFFAQRGYRVVLVDLRGHGGSSGQWIGFGAWEVDDLVKITDELEHRGLLAGKFGVFGASYGAAVGIQWAARDPRVATVVALAPYSDLPTAFPEFARGINPKLAARLSDKTFAQATAKAAALAGFSWTDVNVVTAMNRARVPMFLFHGKNDKWILPSNTEALERVAPAGSRREVTPHDNHMSIMVRFDLIGPPALAWFDEKLAEITAPSLQ